MFPNDPGQVDVWSEKYLQPGTMKLRFQRITFCGTVAETKVLVASPFGWYYHSCHLCPCITHGDIPPFECEAGHSIGAEIFRYKIEIEVAYAGKSCNFVFWNRECELLLGVSASQLHHTMIQARIHDALEFPLALDQMLNLEMTFKDMEITFEHKPGPITPAGKRQLPDGSSESTSFEGLYDGELSSNKLKMIIKLEKNEWAML
ncbi:hypothetical protein RYX36_010714 [Vicia faba]